MNEGISSRRVFPPSPSNNYFCLPDKASQTGKFTQKETNLFWVLFRLVWHLKYVPCKWVKWQLPAVLFPGNYFSHTGLLAHEKRLDKTYFTITRKTFTALTALRPLQTLPVQSKAILSWMQYHTATYIYTKYPIYSSLILTILITNHNSLPSQFYMEGIRNLQLKVKIESGCFVVVFLFCFGGGFVPVCLSGGCFCVCTLFFWLGEPFSQTFGVL